MSTIRSIIAECPSGDGSQLEVTTEGSDSDAVLKFRVDDSEGLSCAAYVSAEQLDQITPFIFREREAWEAAQDDEVVMCEHGLDGEDCVLVDDHQSVDGAGPPPAPGKRRHTTLSGITWIADDVEEF